MEVKMKFPQLILKLLAILLMVLVLSCSGQAVEKEFENFNANNFDNSTSIDN
jgi:hypothetical protein